MMVIVFLFLQVLITGIVNDVPEGKSAPGNIELLADYWEMIGEAPAGGIDNVINDESHVDVLLDNRHLALRSETLSKIMKARSVSCSYLLSHDRSRFRIYAWDVLINYP